MEGERERRQKLLSEKERQINHKKRETHRQREGREVVNLIESHLVERKCYCLRDGDHSHSVCGNLFLVDVINL